MKPTKKGTRDAHMAKALMPHQADARSVFGNPGTNQTQLPLPYPMVLSWDRDHKIYAITINRVVAPSAHRALEKIARAYTPGKRRELGIDVYGGCYNNRPVRGGTAPSQHAYAAAIDFDPERNQLKWNHTKARLAAPDAVAFWLCWESEGWTSLGRARDYDWMHVQAARID